MTAGIPKFRKESHPERAKDKWIPIFSQLLNPNEVEALKS